MKDKKNYNLVYQKSKKARNLRITIKEDGTVKVTVPRFCTLKAAEYFVSQKIDWIEKARESMLYHQTQRQRLGEPGDYQRYKYQALKKAKERVAFFASRYGFTYKNVTVRNQTTRWGSCSSLGSINIHYKIIFLSEHLSDYIIVHELCHLKEMNHSEKFWELVCSILPDYKIRRKELRKFTLHT